MSRRRKVSLAAAAAAAVLAVALVMLAIDVRRSAGRLHAFDLRFDASPTLVPSADSISADLGSRTLGVADDIEFRRVASRFRAIRLPGGQVGANLPSARARIEAELALVDFARRGRDRRRGAMASNLLGILAYEGGRANPDAAPTLRRRSIDELSRALRFDPGYEAAKYNLELVLHLQGSGGGGARGTGRGNQAATSGAVVSPPGRGY